MRMTNNNQPLRVERKIWSTNYTGVNANAKSPTSNGMPRTDPEVRQVKPSGNTIQSWKNNSKSIRLFFYVASIFVINGCLWLSFDFRTVLWLWFVSYPLPVSKQCLNNTSRFETIISQWDIYSFYGFIHEIFARHNSNELHMETTRICSLKHKLYTFQAVRCCRISYDTTIVATNTTENTSLFWWWAHVWVTFITKLAQYTHMLYDWTHSMIDEILDIQKFCVAIALRWTLLPCTCKPISLVYWCMC